MELFNQVSYILMIMLIIILLIGMAFVPMMLEINEDKKPQYFMLKNNKWEPVDVSNFTAKRYKQVHLHNEKLQEIGIGLY